MKKRVPEAPCWFPSAMMVFALLLPYPSTAGEAPRTQAGASPYALAATADDPAGKKATTNPPVSTTSESKKPQNDRLFWTLPNFLTVQDASTVQPLTVRQKFSLVARTTFDPFELAFIGLQAGIGQANNTNPTYGQGFSGYAKRYGTAFGDTTVGNFMANAVYPSLLRQDPRYYQRGRGRGGFLRRFAYAGTRVLVIRSDSGHNQVNFSELLGNATTAGISNAYHPAPRTIGSNIKIWWTQIGWDAVSYELKEFWPDIHQAFQRKSSK